MIKQAEIDKLVYKYAMIKHGSPLSFIASRALPAIGRFGARLAGRGGTTEAARNVQNLGRILQRTATAPGATMGTVARGAMTGISRWAGPQATLVQAGGARTFGHRTLASGFGSQRPALGFSRTQPIAFRPGEHGGLRNIGLSAQRGMGNVAKNIQFIAQGRHGARGRTVLSRIPEFARREWDATRYFTRAVEGGHVLQEGSAIGRVGRLATTGAGIGAITAATTGGGPGERLSEGAISGALWGPLRPFGLPVDVGRGIRRSRKGQQMKDPLKQTFESMPHGEQLRM